MNKRGYLSDNQNAGVTITIIFVAIVIAIGCWFIPAKTDEFGRQYNVVGVELSE